MIYDNIVVIAGQTPLHIACNKPENTRETVVILLTCPEIQVDLKNGNGETAEQIAIRMGPHSLLFEMHRKSIMQC